MFTYQHLPILLILCIGSAWLGRMSVTCNQTCSIQDTISIWSSESTTTNPHYWYWLFLTTCLVVTSGILSGLQPALLGLDETCLHILARSGTPEQQRWAARILPVRRDTTLLMVTLVLANTLVNEALP
jgi:hypothetical protein